MLLCISVVKNVFPNLLFHGYTFVVHTNVFYFIFTTEKGKYTYHLCLTQKKKKSFSHYVLSANFYALCINMHLDHLLCLDHFF